jgi:hypothetical protein
MWALTAVAVAATWQIGKEGNACLAATRLDDGGQVLVWMTRWDDLSDHVQLWRPDLEPLWDEPERGLLTGRDAAAQDADADDGFGLRWAIGDTTSVGTIGFHTMLLDMPGAPGVSYRVGVEKDLFLEAFAAGDSLTLYRRDQPLVEVPIEAGRRVAKRLARCARRPLR